MTTVRSVCPLNCPDCCSFLVEVLQDKIKVHGDVQSMGVNSFVCPKGRALGDMVFSHDRLKYPLLKNKGHWEKVTWEKAYDIITDRIKQTIETVGSRGILHMFDNGHNGRLRELDRRFFQALGGVTEPRGSMCWGAGIKAQEQDFGAVYSSDWEELLHSKTIILWGRDPSVTNKHLIPVLRQARDKGAHIVVINPLKVKSTAFSDAYIQVNPATDGVLALGIAHVILKERWMDFDFVQKYATNFGPYAALAKAYPPEKVAAITGVEVAVIEDLARRITHNGPAMFYLGYGLQRYINGRNTVRAIDALGIISGNIGCQGGGVFYSHQYHQDKLNSVLLPEGSYENRTFPHATMAEDLLKEESNPKIQLAFVMRTNTLVTEPDSVRWRELWNTIDFKVTLDMRMSETAAMSDLVLPITTIFEEEDIIATSWSNRIHYAQQAIEPQGQAKPEPLIFTELAHRLGIEAYFSRTPEEWMAYILAPLQEHGITLEELKKGSIRAPYIPVIAWEDKNFTTPSGKAELIGEEEFLKIESQSPVKNHFEKQTRVKDAQPDSQIEDKVLYIDQYTAINRRQKSTKYVDGYILMTPHPDMAMHTQFQEEEGFSAFIHSKTAYAQGITHGDKIIIENETGQLVATVYLSDDIHEQVVVIPEGTTDNYLGVNCLISGRISEHGESTAYYDTFCQIRKWEI